MAADRPDLVLHARRLHLRGLLGRPARAPVRHARGGHARGLPPPLHAVPHRPRPAGCARRLPLARHLGRPRGRQRLRGAHQRARTLRRRGGARGFSGTARRGLPGLVRAHAGAPVAPRSGDGDPDLRRDGLGPPRALLRARHAPVPLGAGLPGRADRRALRFREGPQDPVRRRGRRKLHRPERSTLQGGARGRIAHRAGRGAGAMARRRARGKRRSLEPARAERAVDDRGRGHDRLAAHCTAMPGPAIRPRASACSPCSRSTARRIPSC